MTNKELLRALIAEIDFIMHDKDYRFPESENTWYSRESCKVLTPEEVFEELRTELLQLNNETNREIAELKKQLEEKEKDNQFFKKMYLSEKQKNDNYHTKKYGLDKPVEELRKIKLTPKEKEIYYKGFDNCERQFATHIAELQQQLKSQPAEIVEKIKENILKIDKIEIKTLKNGYSTLYCDRPSVITILDTILKEYQKG